MNVFRLISQLISIETLRLTKCFIAFFIFISGASTISGFFAAACSLPFEYVKTQIQKMQPDAEGKVPYTGTVAL
jgi:hypothetical protein